MRLQGQYAVALLRFDQHRDVDFDPRLDNVAFFTEGAPPLRKWEYIQGWSKHGQRLEN